MNVTVIAVAAVICNTYVWRNPAVENLPQTPSNSYKSSGVVSKTRISKAQREDFRDLLVGYSLYGTDIPV